MLSIDQGCDVVIQSFTESECHHVQQLTTSTPTTQVIPATMDAPTTASLAERTVPFVEGTTMPIGIGYVYMGCVDIRYRHNLYS